MGLYEGLALCLVPGSIENMNPFGFPSHLLQNCLFPHGSRGSRSQSGFNFLFLSRPGTAWDPHCPGSRARAAQPIPSLPALCPASSLNGCSCFLTYKSLLYNVIMETEFKLGWGGSSSTIYCKAPSSKQKENISRFTSSEFLQAHTTHPLFYCACVPIFLLFRSQNNLMK